MWNQHFKLQEQLDSRECSQLFFLSKEVKMLQKTSKNKVCLKKTWQEIEPFFLVLQTVSWQDAEYVEKGSLLTGIPKQQWDDKLV